jgi:uncharacterized protein
MHIDLYITIAGLIVGFVVGMTGMGGGALMTPVLVLIFGIQPLAAVSSDLVASMVMKPVGASVHLRKRTVRFEVVKWLMIGSIPSAFAGVFVLKLFGDGSAVQDRLKIALGVALLLAASTIVTKAYLQGRRNRHDRAAGISQRAGQPIRVKRVATVAVGAVGGLVVGMTSVGSGSLIIVMMMVLYPTLVGSELVGTDLVQAVPLVAAAAIGHILYGDFELGLTASLLIGAIPGVYFGAKASSSAPDGIVRPALVFVLLASGLKLVNLDTADLGWTMLAIAAIGLPLWGVVDAIGWPNEHWSTVGQSRRRWIWLQAAGAVAFGIGSGAALAYFTTTRPLLAAVANGTEPRHRRIPRTLPEPEPEPAIAVPSSVT